MPRKPTYGELEQRAKQLEREVREQRLGKERVFESEKQLQAIFESVGDGIGIIDKTGKVLKINRRILEVGGYSEEEIVGKRFQIFKMFTPSSIAKMVSAFAKAVSGQHVPPFEVEVRTKGGEKLDLELHTSPLSEGGRFLGGVAVMRNITERKRAEEALRKAHDELERLVEERTAQLTKANEYLKREIEVRKHTGRMLSETNVKLHMLQRVTEAVHSTLDIRQVFKNITDGAVHSMGYTTAFIMLLDDEKKSFEMKTLSTRQGLLPYIDKMLGFPLREFTFPVDAMPNSLIRSVMRGKTTVARTLSEIAYPFISRKICSGLQKLRGTRNYIVAPLQVEGQVVGGLVITSSQEEISKEGLSLIELFTRVASQAIANATLHRKAVQAEQQIRQSLKEKEVMLREIHHRVKNNLQVISSLLKLQASHLKDGAALEMFAESQNRIRAMSLIHERLYRTDDFARIDFSEYARGLTRHLLSIYRATAPQVTLTVEIRDISLDINTAIPCGLILNELVTNCLKHAFPGGRKGTITVALSSPQPSTYELTVRDDGVGIPKGIDITTTKSLGLHLVAILAEDQLNGEIRVSRIGGTTIQIIFKVS